MVGRKLLRHLSSSFADEDGLHGSYSKAFTGTVAQSPNWSPKVGRHFAARNRKNKNKKVKTTVSSKSSSNDSDPGEYKPLVSFIVVYTMIFFNGCCFTAVVPSVPFYLEILSAPPSFLGWVVSFYSVGQLIGSPTGGWLADKMSAKCLLTISSTLGFVSSVIYSLAPAYMLILVARWLTGISAGMEFATELAFIAKNTTKKQRTIYLASVTAVNVVGFILGPALAGALSTLNVTIMGITVDKYTGPGWLLAIMFVVDICMVQGLFKDMELPKNKKSLRSSSTSSSSTEEQNGLLEKQQQGKGVSYGGVSHEDDEDDDDGVDAETKEMMALQPLRESQRPPALPLVLGLIFVQFTVMCAWSVLETITSPLAADSFGWDVQDCNLLFTGGGAVSLVAYVIFVVSSKWVQDRWLIVYALIVCVIGQMLAINWHQLEWVPQPFLDILPSTFRNRFVAGYMIMNAGFMTGRPVTFALYSKLIGSEYQGKYLGWMVAGGSAARTLGPFAAVALYYQIKAAGVNLLALFGSVAIFHVACLFLVLGLWKSLLPSASMMQSIRASMRMSDVDLDEEKANGHDEEHHTNGH
ncbi:Major facilitator superfamily domain-containing protein 8 [Seminavis robusta]|uniref:Major facilitator superfamily domain-containing protein 8 n=1 Tax=Seminavis robusta TaxID=568900 RepID=A0A9N8ECE2_9STRA|nr:Major facilitator superfamily domain-containing protein 8 [Seminavis robusta]|eukprot:Sro883_g215530.1 Major facilitator superfamily domain-containing protein 8 (581) ;mRNA; f:37459-39318